MAYDAILAERLAAAYAHRKDAVRKEMFGGVTYMVNGHMTCGVLKEDLIAKFDPERHDDLMKKPGARPFDFAKRPMRGMAYVGPAGVKTDAALRFWVEEAIAFAESKPGKPMKPGKATTKKSGAVKKSASSKSAGKKSK